MLSAFPFSINYRMLVNRNPGVIEFQPEGMVFRKPGTVSKDLFGCKAFSCIKLVELFDYYEGIHE